MTTKPVLNVEKYAELYKAVEEFFQKFDKIADPETYPRLSYTIYDLQEDLNLIRDAFKECTE